MATLCPKNPCCGCQVCIQVNDYCTGVPISGIVVTVKSGSTVIATCTTDVTGKCCVTIPGAGTYTFSIPAHSPNAANSITQFVNCGDTVTIPASPNPQLCYTYQVTGCNSVVLAGAVLTPSSGTGCTTNSLGTCQVCYPAPGTYTLTATYPRYNTGTQTVTVGYCTTTGGNFALTPASPYVCCQLCIEPLLPTLHLMDPLYGAAVLTYNPTGTLGAGWYGSSAPATNCDTGLTITVNYFFSCFQTLQITWNDIHGLHGCGNCCLPPTGGVTGCPETGAFAASYQVGGDLSHAGTCGQFSPTGYHGGIYCGYPLNVTITE